MVLDRLDNLGRYAGLSEGFAKAARFLAENDAYSLPIGSFEIDGTDVYGFVKETALSQENMAWEAHRSYADIQIILGGGERIGFAPYRDQPVTVGYDERKDCAFYAVEAGEAVTLSPGDFAIFLPMELHRPDCPPGRPCVARKMVVKVRMKDA